MSLPTELVRKVPALTEVLAHPGPRTVSAMWAWQATINRVISTLGDTLGISGVVTGLNYERKIFVIFTCDG
ncbi:hypothetical protein IMPR6_210033 [Imperialibacter sp. EC-SDR9]|nr:hypothetical protein IMPERIA89_350067 [Imperialibacter sp. 89]CAD5289145.1 hypothetical protein IMPERIA75_620068 [Imperialibacter sp. 75]VVT14138.1 hypothetical protein IMPR6_210033 [Imperialibacter sp. EC-SDR9]